MNESDELLTTGEVTWLFGVNPKTVRNWADVGRITAVRTPADQRRFKSIEICRFLDADAGQPQ